MGVVGGRGEPPRPHRPRSQILQRLFQKTVTYSQTRHGNVSTVTITTNLSGLVYYHWYLDGVWVGGTTTNQFSFVVATGEQARIECVPTQDPYFDYVSYGPTVPAARVVLWWIRSADSDVREYKIEQQKDGGSWSTIATVPYAAGAWDYQITSPRLDDLGSYAWRVTPVDAVGNEGSASSLAARTIVRVPDAPDFAIAFDDGTTKVTFSEAA
jgi:hypothetical protein